MANLQTNKQKQYYIPLERTPETVITEEYKDCEVRWSKIGCRKVRTILIPATKEQYYERSLQPRTERLGIPQVVQLRKDLRRIQLRSRAHGRSPRTRGLCIYYR